MPEIKDETLPDEQGMARPAVDKAVEEFKASVYGEGYNEADDIPGPSEASKKWKATSEFVAQEYKNYNWDELADGGKVSTSIPEHVTILLSLFFEELLVIR
ncbi:hypothetical protein LINGRAHAP2_LOCUS5054 [Linum grandiflorum]